MTAQSSSNEEWSVCMRLDSIQAAWAGVESLMLTLKQAFEGHCEDFTLGSDPGSGLGLPRPQGGKCNDALDWTLIGFPADFDPATATFCDSMELLKEVASQWKDETRDLYTDVCSS